MEGGLSRIHRLAAKPKPTARPRIFMRSRGETRHVFHRPHSNPNARHIASKTIDSGLYSTISVETLGSIQSPPSCPILFLFEPSVYNAVLLDSIVDC